jgi:hypothetical protein
MKISRFVVPAMLGLMGLSFTAHNAQAATITWGVATNISGDTDVQTTGTKVGAFNIGDTDVPSTTVNGVTFDAFGFFNGNTTVGNFNLTASSNSFPTTGYFNSTAAPFANLSAPYQSLLGSGLGDFSGPITLTMNGLTTGTDYSFQWWTNNSENRIGINTVTATSGGAVTLDPNTINGSGGLGQFAIGTFTADSASQVINFSGGGSPIVLNGFQLRNVTVPTPEPSTYAMMALGLVALCVLGAKRKKDGQAI